MRLIGAGLIRSHRLAAHGSPSPDESMDQLRDSGCCVGPSRKWNGGRCQETFRQPDHGLATRRRAAPFVSQRENGANAENARSRGRRTAFEGHADCEARVAIRGQTVTAGARGADRCSRPWRNGPIGPSGSPGSPGADGTSTALYRTVNDVSNALRRRASELLHRHASTQAERDYTASHCLTSRSLRLARIDPSTCARRLASPVDVGNTSAHGRVSRSARALRRRCCMLGYGVSQFTPTILEVSRPTQCLSTVIVP